MAVTINVRAKDPDLSAIEALTGTGFLVRTADNTWALRTLTGTSSQITVTNGTGVSGNPTLSIPSTLAVTNLTTSGNTTVGDAAADTAIINAGLVTQPNMPAFAARMASTVASVTGDGTLYSVVWDTEIFDRGADFDPTTGLFTAPVTGIYQLNARIVFTGALAAHSKFLTQIAAGSLVYEMDEGDITPDSSTQVGVSQSILASLTAGQTARLDVQVSGSTKVVGVLGGSTAFSTFSGYLVG